MEREDIGRILRQEREKKGYSKEDVYKATKISIMNIEALEDGDFDALPHPVYTRAFIKTYAEFLGLDPVEFLESYGGLKKDSTKRTYKKPLGNYSPGSKWIWIVLVFLLLIIGTVLLFHFMKKEGALHKINPVESHIKKSDIEKMTGNTSAFTKNELINGTNETMQTQGSSLMSLSNNTNNTLLMDTEVQTNNRKSLNQTSNGSGREQEGVVQHKGENFSLQNHVKEEKTREYKHVLEVVAKDRCWLKGEYDENGSKEAYLLKGQKLFFRFNNSLKVKFGNLGGVDIFLDGKKLDIRGKEGEVKTLKFPTQGN